VAALFLILLQVTHAQQPPKGDGLPGTLRNISRNHIASLSKDIDAIIADPNFADATWGISIVSCENNETLYRHNDNQNRVFASNIKLLTTAAALRRLGGDYRFKTDVFINGQIQQGGELHGDLIIRATGDPSLAPEFGIDPALVIHDWAQSLDSLGIRSLNNVMVDASAFDEIPYAPGWAWDDEPFGFNAPISAAAIYGNSIRVTVTPGTAAGRPVQVTVSPSTAYVSLRVMAVTSRADSTSTLDITRERGSSTITIRGNIAARSEPYTELISIESPPLFFATLVQEELERNGITVRGSAYDAADYDRVREFLSMRLIGEYHSPPMRDIVSAINKQSLNLASEMLVKKLGKEFAKSGSTEDGIDVVKNVLTEAGIDIEHIRLYDGCGLSRLDLIAPSDITRLLTWARHHPLWEDFLASLSIAGSDGTLAGRLRGTLAERNVYGKTGYLGNVRAVSGYVRTRDGEWVAYSIVANN
jgi:PBP4 family serine-type D-alanyl-D-alanine carboxypeptidase